MKFVLVLCAVIFAASCATPETQEPGDAVTEARIEEDGFVTADGQRLGLQVWATDDPVAIVVGLHGMNDYSKTFSTPGPWLAERGIATYALDQRGFGRSPNRGIWAGSDLLVNDARAFIRHVRAQHPDLPVYLMGVSMGASVAISTLAREGAPEVDGLVLVSPAVWGWSSLNPFYRMSLWIAAHTFPGGTLTGSSVQIMPSDNIEMLRDNFNDELFIKKTRTDAIYGLVTLMEEGYSSAENIDVPTLLLYGEKDEIIPRKPVENVASRLSGDTRVVLYQNGYHMLLRDLQAETVWADIRAWLVDPEAEMPSGEELSASETRAPRLSRN